MRALWLLLLIAFVGSGCISRTPLKSLPATSLAGLYVESCTGTNVAGQTESGAGHNARQNSGTGGLAGILLAESVTAATKGDSADVLRHMREQTGFAENNVLDQKLQLQINQAGLARSPPKAARILKVSLDHVALEELQRGYWQVQVSASARLDDGSKNIWSTRVNGCGAALRSLDEFARQPQLYAGDFGEAADDAARQLVSGPIRE